LRIFQYQSLAPLKPQEYVRLSDPVFPGSQLATDVQF
jgi:hypothetical protein